MRTKRLKKIAMVCLTLLLCAGMVQGTGIFVSAKDVSYTTQDGISVGDRLDEGSVLPWPTVEEGKRVGASYVYIYQDAGRGGYELFRCIQQEYDQAYTIPSFDELKNTFWLYMPEGESFSHWEVMDICASVDDNNVTFCWKIKLVRTSSGDNGDVQNTAITSAGAYDLTEGTDYILDGPVRIGGDATFYAQGIRFRVKESGSYTFQ